MLKRLTSSTAPKLLQKTSLPTTFSKLTLRATQKQLLSSTSKPQIKNVIVQKITPFKQEKQESNKRYYNAGTYNSSSTSSQNNVLIPVAAAVAMIGGGIILYQTLNKPITRDETSTRGEMVRSTTIPMHVRDYLFETYKYVAGGLGITALSAFLTFRSGLVYRIMSMGTLSSIGLFIGTCGAMLATQFTDPSNKALKLTGFTAFNALMGITLSSLAFFGPALLIRAGVYTLGVFGAMSFVAMTAKEEKFLFLGGPLFVGLTVLCLASIASFFIPPQYARTLSAIENLVMYGGLALFTMYLLYDTQKIMKHGRIYHERKEMALGTRQVFSTDISSEELRDPALEDVIPTVKDMEKSRSIPQPDYINESIHLYLDLINIFIRMVWILASKDSKRRR